MGHGGYDRLSSEDESLVFDGLPESLVDADCRQVSTAFKAMVARVELVAVLVFGVSVFADMLGLVPGVLLFSTAMGGFFYVDRRLARRAREEAEIARACRSMRYEDFDVTPKGR